MKVASRKGRQSSKSNRIPEDSYEHYGQRKNSRLSIKNAKDATNSDLIEDLTTPPNDNGN